jgi:uncharacterized OB-fold protein
MISPVKIWRNQAHIVNMIGKKGTIVSFTIIRVSPRGFEGQVPFPIVLVEFSKGTRAVGQLVDYDEGDLTIGRNVEAILRRVREPDPEGVIPYGIKFRPI